MKKIFAIFIAMLFICTIPVFAKYGQSDNNGFQDPLIAQQNKNEMAKDYQVNKPNVTGLENAMYRVKNNTTAQHLEQVMERVRTQQRNQLMKMERVQITEQQDGSLEAEGKKQAFLLGFIPYQETHKYTISEDGTVTYRKGQFDFLFKIEK